jgi:chromosome segregation ATPase
MFDPGNIITLVIMLIILVVYRILDKDNRSLEKVKKYTDKLREELSAHADARAEDLHSYAVELEVHQKAAREILRRVQSVEDALNSRTDALGAMASRIAEYDKALTELKEMSARVDENLGVIHEESAFVDGVARTLKTTKEEMERLKAAVPDIRDGIAEDARATVESLRRAMNADLDSAMESVRSEISTLSDKAETSIATVESMHADAARAAESRFQVIESELEAAFARAREEGEQLEDAAFQKLRDQIESRGSRLAEALESRFDTIRDHAKERITETQGMIKTLKADWRKDAEAILAEASASASSAADRIAARMDEAESRVLKAEELYEERYQKIEVKVRETALGLQTKIKDNLKAHQDELGLRQTEIRSAIKEGLTETKAEADRAAAEFEAQLRGFRERGELLKAEQTTLLEGIKSSITSTEQYAERAVEGLNDKFTTRSAELEKRILADFEVRALELSELVEQGLTRLESVRFDADRMEKALRDAMAGVERRVEEDFALFGKDLADRQSAFALDFKNEAARVRAGVKDLENDLNALKAKAYSDVSAKLKIFEDEFFTDLRERRKDADDKFAQWRADMDDRLAAAIREADAAREELDKNWTEEAKASLVETQARVIEQLSKISTQVDAHRQAISERVGEADDALSSLKAAVKADMDDARNAANAYLNAELDRFKHDSGERIQEAERSALKDARQLEEDARAARARYEAAKTAIEAEAKEHRGTFSVAMKSAETERTAALEALAESFKTEASAIGADWEKEKKKIIDTAKTEREALTRDVRSLSDEIGRFRQELSQKTTQALDDFNRSYESLSNDTTRKVRDTTQAMSSSIEDFKREAKTLKDTLEGTRTQMAAALEDEKKTRDRVFSEMDKQIKAFQSQTKLFERADDLKHSLGNAMESMKADLARVESRRAEMAELETQYGRIKRLEDELAQKIARFLAEKRRLDTMEDDFKRLLTLSQAVDQKLALVTASNDQLTQIQAEIRRLGQSADEATEKYERIEKKSNILDSTADAVDKNFQAITELERNVRTIDADIRDVPDRIIDLKRSLDEVMAFKPKLDAAIVRLDEVDGAMVEAEKRATELNKAREWLARAETRFDELNKKSQEHLKMLNDILKDEPSSKRKDKGAPSISVQETVRKLSHQGWKVEEIARAVKLSRGEVELILELGGQD